MFTWGHEVLNWPGDLEGMITYLMTNTSLSTLQVKLMWVGKKREKSNRDVTKSMGRIVWHMFFFHFVLQGGLIASKMIHFPCTKLIVRVSYLFAIFWKNLRKRS